MSRDDLFIEFAAWSLVVGGVILGITSCHEARELPAPARTSIIAPARLVLPQPLLPAAGPDTNVDLGDMSTPGQYAADHATERTAR